MTLLLSELPVMFPFRVFSRSHRPVPEGQLHNMSARTTFHGPRLVLCVAKFNGGTSLPRHLENCFQASRRVVRGRTLHILFLFRPSEDYYGWHRSLSVHHPCTVAVPFNSGWLKIFREYVKTLMLF